MEKFQNNFQPSGKDEEKKWNAHKEMLQFHKDIKQARKELHKRTGGKKLKYAGHLY